MHTYTLRIHTRAHPYTHTHIHTHTSQASTSNICCCCYIFVSLFFPSVGLRWNLALFVLWYPCFVCSFITYMKFIHEVVMSFQFRSSCYTLVYTYSHTHTHTTTTTNYYENIKPAVNSHSTYDFSNNSTNASRFFLG